MAESDKKNYYDLLGVLPSATMTEVKRAYREKARNLHPDLNPNEDEQRQFHIVQEAYNILRDPVERTFYDRGLGLRSNWVDEAAKSSERKRADKADKQKDSDPSNSKEGVGSDPPGAGRARRTYQNATDEGKGSAPNGGEARGKTKGSEKTSANGKRAKSEGPSDADKGGRSSTSASGKKRSSDARRAARAANARQGGRRFTSKQKASSGDIQGTPWYRDRAIRIFLFGVNLLAATWFFVTDPVRGLYPLVIAFGIEGLFRLADINRKMDD